MEVHMNEIEQRKKAMKKVRTAIEDQGLKAEFSAKSIHRFLEFLETQAPSVVQKYADNPNAIRTAIANNFSNLPDADASIMPVRGGQPFNGRHTRRRR
jgi:hypothetical protein